MPLALSVRTNRSLGFSPSVIFTLGLKPKLRPNLQRRLFSAEGTRLFWGHAVSGAASQSPLRHRAIHRSASCSVVGYKTDATKHGAECSVLAYRFFGATSLFGYADVAVQGLYSLFPPPSRMTGVGTKSTPWTVGGSGGGGLIFGNEITPCKGRCILASERSAGKCTWQLN